MGGIGGGRVAMSGRNFWSPGWLAGWLVGGDKLGGVWECTVNGLEACCKAG